VKVIKRRHKGLPLTTRQGLLLLLILGIFFALVFTFVFHVYSLPGGLE